MYAITRKATYRRSLIIFVLVTFLFLPFQKPKKAEAFVISATATGILAFLGGVFLVGAGYQFIDQEMAEFEGLRLMREHGDDLLFEVENGIGPWREVEFVPGSEMGTLYGWHSWTGNIRTTEKFSESVDEFTATVPTSPWSTECIEIPTKFTFPAEHRYEVFQFNAKVATTDMSYGRIKITISNGTHSYSSAPTITDGSYRIYLYKNVSGTYSLRRSRVDNPGSYWDFSEAIKDIGNDLTLTITGLENLEVYPSLGFDYSPSVTEGYSKEQLTEKIPTDVTVGIDKTIEHIPPVSLDKDRPITDIPGVSVQSPSTDIPGSGVITGWDWLDNILNKILDALNWIYDGVMSIPRAIADFFDWCISIPSQISTWWEGLWTDVPAIDFTPLTSVEISKVFPFSIPFDLKNLLEILLAEPKAPVFEIPLWTEKFTFDLTKFNLIADIIRVFCILGWCFYLINRHKQMEE